MNQHDLMTSVTRSDCSARRCQAGFSMIELMVAITLGLLIMTAVLTLYLNLSRNNAELAKMNRQIENGRFTIQMLQQELWHAGFWGAYAPPLPSVTPPTAIPDPCAAFSGWDAAYITNMYAIPVQGYAAGSLPSCVTNPQPNSDALVVRHAAACVAGDATCEAYNANKLYLQTQGCANTGHANYVASAASNPVLGTPGATVYQKNCTTPADKRKLITSVFYVRNYANTAGDGIPTLVRADLDLSGGSVVMQIAQALIDGIQSLKLEYGRDTDNDGSADVFENCAACTATDWANVMAVQVHVLARNLEASSGYTDSKTYTLGTTLLGPFNDSFKRHAYSSYIRLVNPSGRRDKTGVAAP